MNTSLTNRRGFALLQALAAAAVAAWAALALLPAPGTPAALAVQPSEPPAEPPPEEAEERDDAADDAGSEESETDEQDGVTEVVVTLTSGREITGALVSQSEDTVVVRINGIDTTLPRTRVAGVRVLPPVAERYRSLRATVDDNDIRARLALVEWLRARRAYRLALTELEGILEADPGNPDARTLHTWLSNHLAMAARSRPERRARPEPPAPPIPVLTDEQINRIRVFEIDLNTDTRVSVPDDVLRELITRYPGSFPVALEERESVFDLEPMEKLRLIFDRKARDLYDRVQVLEDPPAMATFKSRIHGAGGWLVNACASNRCHGGAEAGRLRLLNERVNSDQTAYTNFMILDDFRLADGTPLINYEQPARSPLLHMALPRHASLYPHPEVDRREVGEAWRHVFRSTSDRRFREVVNWINALYRPRPDYGVEYPPPANLEGDAAPDAGTTDNPDGAETPPGAP